MTDTHCHLNDVIFLGQVEEVVERARNHGVDKLICCATDLETGRQVVELACKYKEIYAAVGIHPESNYRDRDTERDMEQISKLCESTKVIAIGESGLDFKLDTTTDEKRSQIDLFSANVKLANKASLPLVVHCRNAFEEVFSIVRQTNVVGQMHCFTGNLEWMKRFLDIGWYISFGGILTFKSSRDLRELLKHINRDRLLFETDSPYLAPEPLRGSRNEPTNVKIVAKLAADQMGLPYEDIEELTDRNCKRLFGI